MMRNIKSRHKHTKYMNSFIITRLQRKLRKFSENPLSGSWVSGPTFRVPGPTYEIGPGSWVSPTVLGLGSHFLDVARTRGRPC